MHYYRLMRKGDPGEVSTRRSGAKRKNPLVCVVVGCGRRSLKKGYCGMHAQRLAKRGEAGGPEPERPPALGWHHRDGYLIVSVPGRGSVLKHRLVMEERLGRRMERHETVHHINGVRLDNRIENLELWSSHQPRGQRVADKVAWAREIIATYGELYPE